MSEIWYIPEPRCVFGYGQSMEHPKDGLTAFGPVHDPRQPKDMRVGAIGKPDGLRYFRQWVGSIQGPVEVTKKDDPKQSLFPGFSATFRCNWAEDPIASIEIDPKEIEEALRHADGHQRIYNTVSLYESRIAQYVNEEDYPVSVWFVIIPEAIYERGRPKSQVPKGERTHQDEVLSRKQAKTLTAAPFFPFLDALNKGAEMHRYARDFRDQLKGRLLATRAVVQVVRETTLSEAGASPCLGGDNGADPFCPAGRILLGSREALPRLVRGRERCPCSDCRRNVIKVASSQLRLGSKVDVKPVGRGILSGFTDGNVDSFICGRTLAD